MAATWEHPGGKLGKQGPDSLTDAEILAVLISSEIRGRSAETIARELLERFGPLGALASRPIDELAEVKGLSSVKAIRIAAAFELARRLKP